MARANSPRIARDLIFLFFLSSSVFVFSFATFHINPLSFSDREFGLSSFI
jgi:hypothetical protein